MVDHNAAAEFVPCGCKILPCTFPGCTGVFNAEVAKEPGHTGWVFAIDEGDVPVHDHTTGER